MTTIAIKDQIIAADTQLTVDDTKIISSDKITILNKNTIFAGAGDSTAIIIAERFFRQEDWESKFDQRPVLEKREKDDTPLDAILIYKGETYLVDGSLVPEPLRHPYYAVGSGWKFAMAGMFTGMSAVSAVEFASEFDVYTNNKVRWLNVKEFQENSKTKSRRATRASRMEDQKEGSGTEEV